MRMSPLFECRQQDLRAERHGEEFGYCSESRLAQFGRGKDYFEVVLYAGTTCELEDHLSGSYPMEISEAVSIPRFDQLLIPTLTALRELGGSASIDELAGQIIEDLELSPEIVQIPHGRGSRSEIEYRSAWARTYLKKYGLIDNSERGVWAFTFMKSQSYCR